MSLYMEPLVTTIITTHKRQISILLEAVNSVKAQTYKNIEIIIVDDNFEDSVFRKDNLNEFACDDKITLILNSTNIGAQASRNKGVIASKGAFVAFLDDDDIWMPTKIEKQMSILNSDQDIGMVYCDGFSFFDDDITKKGTFREASVYDCPITLSLELFNDFIGSTSQVIVKKECFDLVGMFDTEMPARQDYELWLRICKSFKVIGVPEKLLLYRVHTGERISTTKKKVLESYKLVLSKHRCDFNKQRYSKSKIVLRISQSAFACRRFISGLFYAFYAFFISPSCVFDVFRRKITRKPFSIFYSKHIEKLKKHP